jgi:hypothetical protein
MGWCAALTVILYTLKYFMSSFNPGVYSPRNPPKRLPLLTEGRV